MQDSANKVNKDLLERYNKEKVTSEERAIVERWFADNNLKDQLSISSINLWENIPLDIDLPELEGHRILDRIHHQINREQSVFVTESRKRSVVLRYLGRVAAILLLPVLLTTVFLYYKINAIYNEGAYSEIYAPAGASTTFHLPDGSSGWLNGGSSIKFPAHFHKKNRCIELSGEAYLNVTEDPCRPFIVTTSNIKVRVIGTSFNIMAYDDDLKTEVTLESGSVEVLKKRNKNTVCIGKLKPDQALIYYHKSDSSYMISVKSSDKTSWKDGKLVFRYDPLCEVINKINRWYNVDIKIMDPELNDHKYYGTFQNETLSEVLKLLQYTAPIRYKDMGRQKKPDGTYDKRIIELYSKKQNSKTHH